MHYEVNIVDNQGMKQTVASNISLNMAKNEFNHQMQKRRRVQLVIVLMDNYEDV